MHTYYVVLSGCNKDHPQPLIIRESKKEAISYLSEKYQVTERLDEDDEPLFGLECELKGVELWREFVISKEVANEHNLYDKFNMFCSKNCGRLRATLIRAKQGVEIGDIMSSIHVY
jgi:hypothetical protein